MNLTLFLVALSVVVFQTMAYTCFSKDYFHSKLKEMHITGQKIGMTDAQLSCIHNEGMKYKPTTIQVDSALQVECIKDTEVSEYMVHAMTRCVGEDVIKSESRLTTLRRRVKAEGGLSTVASWFGVSRMERRNCHCWSGCHFCCIQTAIGGNDFCFELYCFAVGSCDLV